MGPYCKFCDQRCFITIPADAPKEALLAYGTSSIIATCKAGQEFERQKTGWCLDRIRSTTDDYRCVRCGAAYAPQGHCMARPTGCQGGRGEHPWS